MNDKQKDQMVKILAAAISWGISHYVVEHFSSATETKEVSDDIRDAVIKGAVTASATALASVLVRRVL